MGAKLRVGTTTRLTSGAEWRSLGGGAMAAGSSSPTALLLAMYCGLISVASPAEAWLLRAVSGPQAFLTGPAARANLKCEPRGVYAHSVWEQMARGFREPLPASQHRFMATNGIDSAGNEPLAVKQLIQVEMVR